MLLSGIIDYKIVEYFTWINNLTNLFLGNEYYLPVSAQCRHAYTTHTHKHIVFSREIKD
jgi:hypothetical protein